MLTIRKSTREDLDRMCEIFSHARQKMKENGNPDQWRDDRPPLKAVLNDIEKGNSFVIESEGKIVATFAYIRDIEPTYLNIEGAWLNDKPYGTIHRIASDNSHKDIFDLVMRYISQYKLDTRIDTHSDNKPMLHLMEKNGFVRCGIIYVDDGTPRIAFQKVYEDE